MKHILTFLLPLAVSFHLSAQATLGGTVIYTRTITYDFQETGNPEWDAYAKTLPGEGKFEKQLLFTTEASLYQESLFSEEALSGAHQKAAFFVNYGKPPSPAFKQLYIDFRKEERSALMEFMTRDFRITEPLEKKNWKLLPERKKIGDYVCMKATATHEGDEVIAWFTPEIPVSAGPAEYYGLPGLVLAVERLNETIFLASLVDLTPPDQDLLEEPGEGRLTSPEDFEKIVAEKVEEFKQNGVGKSDYYSK
jgi:GLPGLI family protein